MSKSTEKVQLNETSFNIKLYDVIAINANSY